MDGVVQQAHDFKAPVVQSEQDSDAVVVDARLLRPIHAI